jgi:hypothetical protein
MPTASAMETSLLRSGCDRYAQHLRAGRDPARKCCENLTRAQFSLLIGLRRRRSPDEEALSGHER